MVAVVVVVVVIVVVVVVVEVVVVVAVVVKNISSSENCVAVAVVVMVAGADSYSYTDSSRNVFEDEDLNKSTCYIISSIAAMIISCHILSSTLSPFSFFFLLFIANTNKTLF